MDGGGREYRFGTLVWKQEARGFLEHLKIFFNELRKFRYSNFSILILHKNFHSELKNIFIVEKFNNVVLDLCLIKI